MLSICIRCYVYSGFLAAFYGLLSYFFMFFWGIEFGGAYGEYGVRLRGFYVEGGPYGLFAGTVILVLINVWNYNIFLKSEKKLIFVIVAASFFLAQSKSSFFAFFVVILLSFISSNTQYFTKNIFQLFSFSIFIVLIIFYSGVDDVIERLYRDKALLIENADYFSEDTNYIMGRVAGSVIVPEMILKNPWLGVGIGNYSLLRDSEKYNRYLPKVDMWDLHGLGLFGFAAEVGFLGVLFFLTFFFMRYFHELKKGKDIYCLAMAAYPMAALIFGVQPTFSYPWILLAISESIAKNKKLNFNNGKVK
ncbi:MAG: O-antigen ligase family protein [Limnohabitans sp.]